MANKYEHIINRLGGKPVLAESKPESAPISEDQLAQYEEDLGYKLPADYKEFLRDYAFVGFDHEVGFPLKDDRRSWGTVDMFQGIWPVKELNEEREKTGWPAPFPIEWAPTLRKVLQLDEETTEVEDPPRELLAIAIDPGGNQVYLALAGLHPGAVFLWMNWGEIYFVADSFDEFMNSLRLPGE